MAIDISNFDMTQFEIVKNVTRDFFIIPEDGTPIALKFETPFVVDETIEVKMRRNTKDSDKKKEPMEIANCINVQTGELGRLIGNEVVKSELRGQYPDDTYVGKMFLIAQGAKKTGRGGNNYRTFRIVELRAKAPAAGSGSAAGSDTPKQASQQRRAG